MSKKNKHVREIKLDAAEESKVDFDTWYAVRKHLIPDAHKKEILKADFIARKVPAVTSMEEFDKALNKYGIQL